MAPYCPLGTTAGHVILLLCMCECVTFCWTKRPPCLTHSGCKHFHCAVFLCVCVYEGMGVCVLCVCLSAWLQFVWQFEKSLLIVDNVQVVNARPHLCTVNPDYLVAWLIALAVANHSHCVCDHMQLLKIDQVVMEGLISLMDKGDIFQEKRHERDLGRFHPLERFPIGFVVQRWILKKDGW